MRKSNLRKNLHIISPGPVLASSLKMPGTGRRQRCEGYSDPFRHGPPTLSEATLWQISERPPRPKGKSITRGNAAHGNAPASEQLLLFEQYSTPPWLWHASRLNHTGRVTKSPWIPISGFYSSGRTSSPGASCRRASLTTCSPEPKDNSGRPISNHLIISWIISEGFLQQIQTPQFRDLRGCAN